MKKVLIFITIFPIFANAQWSSIGILPNFSQNQSGHIEVNNYMDFKINDLSNDLYVIHPNSNSEIYRYTNNNWSSIGDSGQMIAFDENNILYKISLNNLFLNPNNVPIGGIIKIHSFINNNWNVILFDTIFNLSDGINNFNGAGIFLEDFIVRNNQFYFSISDIIITPPPQYQNDQFIRVFNYDNTTNLITELPTPNIIKTRYFYSNTSNVLSTSNIMTELDFEPSTGDLLICGQQFNSNLIRENVVKRYDGNNWQIHGNIINLSNFIGNISSDYISNIKMETSLNGDLILAFSLYTQQFDFSIPNDLLLDTLIILKYNSLNNSWNDFSSSNPELNLYYLNQFSLTVSSDGTPFIAYQNDCDAISHPTNLSCIYNHSRNVIYYDMINNSWNQLNTPMISSGMYADFWDEPLIQLNNNNEICVYYVQALTGIVSLKCHQNILTNIKNNHNSKKIISIKDLLGKDSKIEENKILFYIYDDGSVEKKVIIE